MTGLLTSNATVDLDRAERFGKQLTTHLSRRHGGEWSSETKTGWIDLQDGKVNVEAAPGGLVLRLEASPAELGRLEAVVGGHLIRFVSSPGLSVSWTRADGTDGTTQH